MYRAAKNAKGVIICFGRDEGQSGNFPAGSSDEEKLGEWCSWVFEEFLEFAPIEGAERLAARYKENKDGDGLKLRTKKEVLSAPQG